MAQKKASRTTTEPTSGFPKAYGINCLPGYLDIVKYCLVQEYGFTAHVSPEELDTVRKIVCRYGVFDVKAENLMRIDNQLKIIDVNMTPFPLPTVWKMVDEVKPKLPKQLCFCSKKLRRCLMIDNLRRKGVLDFGMFLGCLNFTETMNPAPTAPNDVFAPGFRCNGILHISKP